MPPRIAHGCDLRKGRVSETGRAYLLTAITNQRRPVFTNFNAGLILIAAMKQAEDAGRIESFAWVIMPDHLHWLVCLNRGSLGALMRDVKSQSGRLIKRAAGSNQPIWQAGYHDRAIRGDEELLATARYVVANPLRAGLVTRIADYPLWDAKWL